MRSVSRACDIEFNRCRCEDTNSWLLRDEARRTPSRGALQTEAVDAGGIGGKSAESAVAVDFQRGVHRAIDVRMPTRIGPRVLAVCAVRASASASASSAAIASDPTPVFVVGLYEGAEYKRIVFRRVTVPAALSSPSAPVR